MAGTSGSTCSLTHAPVRCSARRQQRRRQVVSAAATAGTTHAAAEQAQLGSSDLLVSSECRARCCLDRVSDAWLTMPCQLGLLPCARRERRTPIGQTAASAPPPAECCLGTMTWGMQNSEAEAHQQLSCAWDDYGINFLDTAEIYPVPPAQETQGRTEQYIGSWLKGRKRDSVVLATKVCCCVGEWLVHGPACYSRCRWLQQHAAVEYLRLLVTSLHPHIVLCRSAAMDGRAGCGMAASSRVSMQARLACWWRRTCCTAAESQANAKYGWSIAWPHGCAAWAAERAQLPFPFTCAANIEEALNKSLARLGTDHV